MWDSNTLRQLNDRLATEGMNWYANKIVIDLDPVTADVREVWAELYSGRTGERVGREILQADPRPFCSNCCERGHTRKECQDYNPFWLTYSDEQFLKSAKIARR